ncbi:Rpn family recombination-promoting nuclease/putative transposase [Massilia violaceinigra]|uniref:Rpn family recombination-promoting nuclease/putative transposase n=1 Tax=Massilia violaceinigra TaxID=2045208 RepID=A0ABY4AEU6_9BURK|nr:Rpn family recombination-promoting nuclease/putative transposase [Massilia violaceinigra]UOD32670.1 Rpn family recombination-promoting nuclease/putative transposase [Massilia violaceinigra]
MTTQQHDLGYRALFAHPEMVRELVTGFTAFKLFDGVALSAFERVNADYVSERPSARQGDVVWRVRIAEHVLDVVILLEFQSGVDRCMALRMHTYVGLLCQDLVKRHQLSPELLLPPVLPLVFYNGVPAWSAPKELAELLTAPPAELAALQPSQRYALIDQWRLDRAALDANDDLLALLFRIELSRFPDVLKTHVPALKTWFRTTPLTSLRTSVWAWWKALLERKTHNTQLFNLDSAEEGDMDVDLATLTWDEQMQIMAEQRALVQIEKATQEAAARAMAEGTAQGRAQGKAEELIAFRSVLKNILRIKFGEVPPLVSQRIDQSAQAELAGWIERSISAPTLAALFGDDAAPVQAGRT